MPRKFAKNLISTANDRDYKGLTIDEQWFYQHLCKLPTISLAGVVVIPRKSWADFSRDPDTVQRIEIAIRGLAERNYLVIDEDTDEILVRTFMKHDGLIDGPHGPFKAALVAARDATSPRIRAALYRELMKLDPVEIEKRKVPPKHEPVIVTYRTTLDALRPATAPPPHDTGAPTADAIGDAIGDSIQRSNGTVKVPHGARPSDAITASIGDGIAAASADAITDRQGTGTGAGTGTYVPVPEISSSESALRAPRARMGAHALTREAPPAPDEAADGLATVVEIPGLFASEVEVVPDADSADPDPPVLPPARRRTRQVPARKTPAEWSALARSPAACDLVKAWADAQPAPPVASVVVRLGQQASPLLTQGWSVDDVTAALDYWAGKTVGPGCFQSVADEWRRLRHRRVEPPRKPTRVEVGMTSGQRAFAALRAQQNGNGQHPRTEGA